MVMDSKKILVVLILTALLALILHLLFMSAFGAIDIKIHHVWILIKFHHVCFFIVSKHMLSVFLFSVSITERT